MTDSRSIHVSTNDPVSFFLWLIFCCIYVPHLLYSFICQWALGLFPCPGYCKQCFSEHWGTCVFLNYGFLRVYGEGNDTHSSTLAWKIPRTEEPGRLPSVGSQSVGHDWATSLSLFIFMHWRRKWQPTPVFLPGESHGWRSLVGCCLWGHTELDTTEAT